MYAPPQRNHEIKLGFFRFPLAESARWETNPLALDLLLMRGAEEPHPFDQPSVRHTHQMHIPSEMGGGGGGYTEKAQRPPPPIDNSFFRKQ